MAAGWHHQPGDVTEREGSRRTTVRCSSLFESPTWKAGPPDLVFDPPARHDACIREKAFTAGAQTQSSRTKSCCSWRLHIAARTREATARSNLDESAAWAFAAAFAAFFSALLGFVLDLPPTEVPAPAPAPAPEPAPWCPPTPLAWTAVAALPSRRRFFFFVAAFSSPGSVASPPPPQA